MPKPNFKQWHSHHEHDDRDYRTVENRDRRVTFKHGGGQQRYGGKNKGRDWSNAIREHLEEEDIDMNIGSGSGRNFKKGGKKVKGRRGSPLPRKLFEGPFGWYKVAIPYGDKFERSFMQKLLLDKLAPLPFWPVAWQTNGTTVMFYVDDYKVAEKLLSLDRQVQLPNGFKLIVKVHPGVPNVDMTPATKEKIKLVMAKRYNATTKALDLTKFHADPDLQDIFCALFKPIVFLAVLDIIAENIPNLEAISLNENRLSVLGFLKKVSKKMPNVKILHIAKNKLKDIVQLDVFIGLPVTDLLLDGNPLCDKYKDQTSYVSIDKKKLYRYTHMKKQIGLNYFTIYDSPKNVCKLNNLCFERVLQACNVFPRADFGSSFFSVCSEVRKRFPKCLKLDGVDLPPPISFDISEETHLPDPQQTFLCSADGEIIVRQFLEQYFLIYDTENRQPLLQAYHEHAMFSYTMAYPYGYGKDKNVAWLNWYNTDNRNILRVQDSERRSKLLRQGQLSVVSFLQDMPQTKHDIHSFTVDLSIYTPQMLCLTVSGIFREIKSGHKTPPTRFFFRTLVIVPAGSGFCIANEQLHVTNATPDQAKEAFKTPSLSTPAPGTAAPPTTPEASPLVSLTSPLVASPGPSMLDNATKEEMVKQMSLKTGMNIEWSIKCLEGNDWDFNRAGQTFENLQSQGVVPPEAFVK